MGRLLKAGAILAGLALLGWTAWHPLVVSYQHFMLRDMFVTDPPLLGGLGPAQGSHFPGLHAQTAQGQVRLVQTLAGPAGTVIVNLRSVAEDPFCAEQLRQLQHYAAQFRANGVALVALAQDAPAVLESFAARNAISIPLLSDTDRLSVKTLGLLAQSSGSGGENDTMSAVVPGVILVGSDGLVKRTLVMADPHKRIDSKTLLSLATTLHQSTPAG